MARVSCGGPADRLTRGPPAPSQRQAQAARAEEAARPTQTSVAAPEPLPEAGEAGGEERGLEVGVLDDERVEAVVAQLTRETWLRKQRGEVDALTEVVQDTKEQLWRLQISMDDYSLQREPGGGSPAVGSAQRPAAPATERPASPPAASPYSVGAGAAQQPTGLGSQFGLHNPFASPTPMCAPAVATPQRPLPAVAPPSLKQPAPAPSDDARLIDFLLREKAQLEEDLAEREIILSALEAKWQSLATAVQEISADSRAKDVTIVELRAELRRLKGEEAEDSEPRAEAEAGGCAAGATAGAAATDGRGGAGGAGAASDGDHREGGSEESDTGRGLAGRGPEEGPPGAGGRAQKSPTLPVRVVAPGKRGREGEQLPRSTRPCTPPKRVVPEVADFWSNTPFTVASAAPTQGLVALPSPLLVGQSLAGRGPPTGGTAGLAPLAKKPPPAKGGKGEIQESQPRPPLPDDAPGGEGAGRGRHGRTLSHEMLTRLDEKLKALSGPTGEPRSGSAWAELDAWSSRVSERKASLGRGAPGAGAGGPAAGGPAAGGPATGNVGASEEKIGAD